ncbi:lysine methyltransferase 5Ab isoform X2 [Syngnathus typhle]|uniref:lysine methyltransferase 5Ab isoform X2 n=1 Tax=Syngnathus typhle TaxID=161592 RepID=UPI002A6AF73C|nr:lysine methyltransferase 5Ab isoform X2 [Syngnathus typhle]
MAKGKKQVQRTDEKPETVPVSKGISEETKENRPLVTKEPDCTSKAPQSVRPSPPSSKKAILPLRDTSGMLIQDGGDADVNHTAKLDKDTSNKTPTELCEAKVASQPQQKQTTTNASLADNSKVPAAKPRSRNPRKGKGKKTENNASQNRKVTDFFPIRRSKRKTKAELKNEEHKHLDDLIKNGVEEGMQVRVIEGKGRGVFAERRFKKGDFVVEYHGDLLELAEAKLREARYSQDPQTGCYMYYFQYQAKTYCVDATRETKRLGRLINHSKVGNCQTKLHAIDGSPHLILLAARDIEADEELLYDYGDRSQEAISAHPWLKH